MTITTTQQAISVTDVGSVTITDTTNDVDEEQNPIYVREVRVYKESATSSTKTLLFTLRLTGTTEEAIELVAPAQTF